MSSGHSNQFDIIDDYSIELVCDQLFKNKDYSSLCNLTLTSKRMRSVCQKYLDKIHQGINLMISGGEANEDYLRPLKYIQLIKIKQFLKEYGNGAYGKSFYISVMIPNKRLDNMDFMISLVEVNDGVYSWYEGDGDYEMEEMYEINPNNLASYCKFIELFTNLYEERLLEKDIY